MLPSISDVDILWAKIWNKVVNWMALGFFEGCFHLVVEFALSLTHILLSCSHVDILRPKVWHKIVDLPGWFIPTGVGNFLVPWDGSVAWGAQWDGLA